MKYILLIDEDPDILNIQQLVLTSFYGGEIIAVSNGSEALERLEAFGEPEVIISDQSILEEAGATFYSQLCEKDLLCPLVICSGDVVFEQHEKKYPNVSAFVRKPFSVESLTYLIKSITTEPTVKPDFLPVKLSILFNFIGRSFDLHLKLSDVNYVKLVKQGEGFSREDCEKLLNKGVTHLHISSKDSLEFLKAYEENLNFMLSARNGVTQEAIVDTIDNLVSIENVSKHLGWTPEVIESAKKSIDTAIRILSKDPSLANILKQKLANPTSGYARHLGLQAYLCCVLSADLAWGGESVQNKLALATLLHDLVVDEKYYDDIKSWNTKAANPKERSPEVIKYRLHPMEASKFIQKLENMPPDIDQILLQHHEKIDGSGFPRGLTTTRISQLATFFIIIEELIDFIGDGMSLESSFADFKTWGDATYSSGVFKKTYLFIRDKI